MLQNKENLTVKKFKIWNKIIGTQSAFLSFYILIMSLLRKLNTKKEVDEAIRTVEERVLVLRFGRDDEIGCLQTDDIMFRTENLLREMAEIYTVNLDSVPVYKSYFEVTHIPATIFFFNGQHIKIDSGTPDNTKFVGPFQTKQDFIDTVEIVFRGAMRGKYIVKFPIDQNRITHFDLIYKNI